MCVHGMNETLCYGLHSGVIKRGSCMGLYVDMRESNTPRLRACFEVMLCRDERLGIPLLMRAVAICYAERLRLGLGLSSVLTGDAEGSRACFWGAFPMDGGGVANTHFLEAMGVAWCVGNPHVIIVRAFPLLDLDVPRFPFCDYIKIRNVL